LAVEQTRGLVLGCLELRGDILSRFAGLFQCLDQPLDRWQYNAIHLDIKRGRRFAHPGALFQHRHAALQRTQHFIRVAGHACE
jgi:hypothetical protein